jgi:uncharacterized protein YjiK
MFLTSLFRARKRYRSSRRIRHHSTRLVVEGLEHRCMLTSSVDAFPLQFYDSHSSVTDLPPTGNVNEWSGLAYWTDGTTDALFALAGDNSNYRIVKFDLSGSQSLQSITLNGFSDPEGLTWMGGNSFALAEEDTAVISKFTITSSTTQITKSTNTTPLTLTGTYASALVSGSNMGIEGIAYSPYTNEFYLTKEQTVGTDLKGIYKVNGSNGAVTVLTTNLPSAFSSRNLTDIYYGRGQLLILGEGNNVSAVVARYNLYSGSFSSNTLTIPSSTDWNAEGLTMRQDGFEMFVVADEASPDFRRLRLNKGDIDSDGRLLPADLDVLHDAVNGRITQQLSIHDLNGSGTVTDDDVVYFLHIIMGTWYGDANLNGSYDSSDLVLVSAAGEYEDGIPDNSTWIEGDWDGDEDYGTGDLVIALADGGYELAK